MKAFRLLLAALLLAGSCITAQAQELEPAHKSNPFAALPWQRGPATAHLGNNATIDVPQGYVFLDPAGTRQLDRLNENPPSPTDTYTLAPDNLAWMAYFSFENIGYVKDDDKLDADAILSSYREGTTRANEQRRANGWGDLNVIGWQTKPSYDPQIRSLAWSILLEQGSSHQQVVNYNTRLLGRYGVMDVVLVTAPARLDTSIADFKNQLPSFHFAAGSSYAEYRAGDKVAEYGLAALITGGALAVAAKKGLFTVILGFLAAAWKFILAGFAVLASRFKSLFKKKQA